MTVDGALKQDAAEMMHILATANCVKRHSSISHDRLAEILTAMVTGGSLTLGNKEGHDVISPTFGRIEVKSRVLGTDGPFPRVSLRASNLQHAEYFVAVRWTRDMDLYEAVGVLRSSAEVLYTAKLQKSGRGAHIGWNEWIHVQHEAASLPCRVDRDRNPVRSTWRRCIRGIHLMARSISPLLGWVVPL